MRKLTALIIAATAVAFMSSTAIAAARTGKARANRIRIEYVPPKNPALQMLYEMIKERLAKTAGKLAAMLIDKALVREVRAKPGMPVWRRNEQGRSRALIITRLGRTAIQAQDNGEVESIEPRAPARAPTDEVTSVGSEQSTPRQGSKLATVIDLLGRKRGAVIDELITATGWLPHTTRAALTGLRKRGYTVERERSETGGSVYRIVSGKASNLAA
jgi:hypothetical protein